MKKMINKINIEFPIHFQSFEETDSKYILEFLNIHKKNIGQLKIHLGMKSFLIDVNTSQQSFKVEIEKQKESFSLDSVYIEEAFIDHEKKVSSQQSIVKMAVPTSVFSLRPYHRIYQSLQAQKNGQNSKSILYVAKNFEHYWQCSCGERHIQGIEECPICGTLQKDIKDTEIRFEEEAKKTKIFVFAQHALFIWLSIAFIFQILYEALVSDILYENLIKNHFFGVFNRMILPTVLIIFIFSTTFTRLKAKKKLNLLFCMSSLLIFVYLNILSTIYFIYSSYNLIFLVAFDLGVLWMTFYWITKKWNHFIFYAIGILSLISILITSVNYFNFSHYDLRVQQNGLHLFVNTDEKEYLVPDTINGLKVVEIEFPAKNEFSIESLIISRYVEKIRITSAIILDDLKFVSVNEENPHFYTSNNIVYSQNGEVVMVPVYTESLYIDDEIIMSGPFRDLIYLKELTLGPNVKLIKHEAFINARSLTTIIFAENSQIESIEEYAFSDAISLKSIDLPISLKHLEIGILFGAESLESLRAPFIGPERETSEYLYLSHDLLVYFFGSKTYLHADLIPSSLKRVEFYDIDLIHHTTFYNAASIEEIILPINMTEIGIRSFYGTSSLITFNVPDGVNFIPESSFENSGIKSIIIPASIRYIDINAFKNTELEEIIYLGNVDDLSINPIGNEEFIILLNSNT
ncbi:MAG: leucine-rich repeat protein [Acholeplasmataceae bacterium]|nr:leucine-rich repeat protein [Acholeplasmataceae bacterium]